MERKIEIISREEFAELADSKVGNKVSIYLPTHSSGVEVNEKHDVLVFKNLVHQAKQQLQAKNVDTASIEKLLLNAYELIGNEKFWKEQEAGLAVLISEETFRVVKVPFPVKEKSLVNSSFFLSPLVPLIKDRKPFYLLVLSKNNSRLYEGDIYGMSEMEVEGLPNGMNDVIHFEEKSGQKLMKRSGAPGGSGSSEGMNFHGHGSSSADDTEYLVQYLKEVDQTLWKEVLSTKRVPLVIAGVEYVLAKFKLMSAYKYINKDNLTGNFEQEHKNSLYEKVRPLLNGYFKDDTKKALLNYYNNSANGLTTSITDEVIPASYYGQISDLFVVNGTHIWGTFNEQDNKLQVHESKQDQDDCLVEQAVIRTIMNGGDVHLLEKDKMPAESEIAAFLRYGT